MNLVHVAQLLALGALWGASYIFMKLGAGEFGAIPLAALRAGGAAICLLAVLAGRGRWKELHRNGMSVALVGVTNSALPFVLFAYAAQIIPAGLSSIFSAAAPLFTALIARFWLGERFAAHRIAGLALGFIGVVGLVVAKGSFSGTSGSTGATGWATLACLAATTLYGFSSNYTRKQLHAVPPLVVAAGSQLASAVVLALPAALTWPAATPSGLAWIALACLAVACTALAYILFFRLIAEIGAPRTMTVTFLIPVFGVLWGSWFLGERYDVEMLAAGIVILLGTILSSIAAPRFSCRQA